MCQANDEPAAVFAFDVLQVDGRDYRQIVLIERKAALKKLLWSSKLVRCVQHIEEKGEALFAEVDRLALEGIVAKRAKWTYFAGGTRQWLNIKTVAGRMREEVRIEHRHSR